MLTIAIAIAIAIAGSAFLIVSLGCSNDTIDLSKSPL
jgi:hypothetical protein